MNYSKQIYFISIVVITILSLYSCKGKKKHLTDFKVDEKVQHTFESERNHIKDLSQQHEIGGFTIHFSAEVQQLYESTDYFPLWYDGEKVNPVCYQLIALFHHADDYGLSPNEYHCALLDSMISPSYHATLKEKSSNDVLLSSLYFYFGSHLKYGLLDSSLRKRVTEISADSFQCSEYLLQSKQEKKVLEHLLMLQPQTLHYKYLQSSLQQFIDCYGTATHSTQVNDRKTDSVNSNSQMIKALLIHHFLDSSDANNAVKISDALSKFQSMYAYKADGVIGTNTAKNLSQSNYSRWLKAALSMEKWKKESWYGQNYLLVNIAGFQLDLVVHDTVVDHHKVIVGKLDTKTPLVASAINSIITNPFWHVPFDISAKEFIPKLRKDSTYLKRNKFVLFDKNQKEVDATKVDWDAVSKKNFHYRIRQNGGSGNSLGYIKFNFDNKYSVYLHDTQTKGLFGNDIRAYSHGCVRVQDPIRLAGFLLRNDQSGFSEDSLAAIIHKGDNISVRLKKPFPIYLRYFTAAGDASGNIQFYQDVYKRDSLSGYAMFGK